MIKPYMALIIVGKSGECNICWSKKDLLPLAPSSILEQRQV